MGERAPARRDIDLPRGRLAETLVLLSGSHLAQSLLARLGQFCRYLQGIGAADSVERSGERYLLERLQAFSQAPVIFDVGANRGQYANLVGRVLGARPFELHCFEPSPQAFLDLEQRLGGDPRCHLSCLALAEEAGRGVLHFDQPGSPLSSMLELDRSHWGIDFSGRTSVGKETVDAYCQRVGIARIHLLKLDVEGYEMAVLAGARRMLGERRVDGVCFEFGAAGIEAGLYFRDFYRFLSSHGMELSRITPSGYLQPVPAYTEHLEAFLPSNYLACRRGRFGRAARWEPLAALRRWRSGAQPGTARGRIGPLPDENLEA